MGGIYDENVNDTGLFGCCLYHTGHHLLPVARKCLCNAIHRAVDTDAVDCGFHHPDRNLLVCQQDRRGVGEA